MKRIAFIDFVRVFACFLVILVHSSENYYGAADPGEMAGPQSWLADETDRLWVSVYDGFSRMAVPLFIIVSAYLLVPMRRGVTMGEFYLHRFRRVVPPFVIFMILYSVLPMLWGQFSREEAVADLVRIPFNFPSLAGHLWFMYPLISIYLIIPIVSPWLERATPRQERVFIYLFALSTCMPWLRRWFGELWGECFWNEYHMLWYFSGYLGYVVVAHYIRVHLTWTQTRRLVIGALMMIAGAVATILSFYVQAVPQALLVTPEIEIGWAFCTINCVVLTVGAFLMFSCIHQNAPGVVTSLARQSYTIYLMHIFWLGVWVSLFKIQLALPTVISIPAIAICTFATCWLCTWILSFIPGSEWLGIDKPKAKTMIVKV